jgi:hypothetical protein
MIRSIAIAFLICIFCSLPAYAETDAVIGNTTGEVQLETSQEAAPVADEQGTTEEPPETPKKKEYTDTPQVRLRILDKVRAESRTYDLEVGHTVAYANIRIRPRSCRKSSPLDDPESASFLQIWEVLPDGKSSWVFSGWMFASSPSLSAMDHAVYDVTVLDCRDPKAASEAEPKPEDAVADEETRSATDAAIDEYIGEEPVNETPSSESAPDSSE